MLIWLVSFVKQGGNIGNLFSALSWPSTLEVLRLNHNQFEGEWKVNTERLPENLREIYVRGNRIRRLPEDLFTSDSYASLRVLDISYNDLEAPICGHG